MSEFEYLDIINYSLHINEDDYYNYILKLDKYFLNCRSILDKENLNTMNNANNINTMTNCIQNLQIKGKNVTNTENEIKEKKRK